MGLAGTAWIAMALGALAGAGAGTLSGLFGIGGGIVLVPLLGLILGVGQHEAQGLSLAVLLLPNGLPAVLEYRRQGTALPWRVACWLLVGFLGGILAGAHLANGLPARGLQACFAAFLVFAAVRTFGQTLQGRAETKAEREPALPWLLAAGILGGLASGLLGIGGGIVMIPLLVAGGMSQRRAQLASLLLMLAPVGLPGLWVYVSHGRSLPYALLTLVAAGFLGGAWAGARLAGRLRAAHLTRAFAFLLVGMAVATLIR